MSSGLFGNLVKKESISVSLLISTKIYYKGIFSVTLKRVQKFKNLLKAITELDFPTARFVAKVVGTIISMGLGLGYCYSNVIL